jgi:hypothetical protein
LYFGVLLPHRLFALRALRTRHRAAAAALLFPSRKAIRRIDVADSPLKRCASFTPRALARLAV